MAGIITADRIILGVDPGTQLMGYGLIAVRGKQLDLIKFDVINLTKQPNQEIKLKKIFEEISAVIEEFLPDEMALEAPFYGKNIQSMLKLGRAQGVAMAAALVRQIPIVEYAPRKIKQSVTGNGNASKEQVAAMLKTLFKFQEVPKLLDATDALAVAVCHHFQSSVTPVRGSKSWGAFLSENPHRLK